jgi:flagellar biosynthesis protein FliR
MVLSLKEMEATNMKPKYVMALLSGILFGCIINIATTFYFEAVQPTFNTVIAVTAILGIVALYLWRKSGGGGEAM